MPASLTSIVLISFAMALQTVPPPVQTPPPPVQTPPPQTTPTPSPQATPTPKPTPPPAPKPGSLALTVTNEAGAVLTGVEVRVHGPVDRTGTTNADGVVSLVNMPAGTYRCRITPPPRLGLYPLDKEIVIRAGVRTATEGVLSPAPPAPPLPPTPTPTATPTPTPSPVEPRPATPGGAPGVPKVLSLIDLIEPMLKDPQPIVEREIGCSFSTVSKLIVARDPIALHRHPDADEILYVVAGEATLTLAGRDQVIAAGWFGQIPRGTAHSVIRRSGKQMVLLSVQSGVPCGAGR